jgi:hypothetical protein
MPAGMDIQQYMCQEMFLFSHSVRARCVEEWQGVSWKVASGRFRTIRRIR